MRRASSVLLRWARACGSERWEQTLVQSFASSSAGSKTEPLMTAEPQPEPVSPQRWHTVGQPSVSTHPHLLEAGELTPGISSAEYADRRQRLMSALPPGSLVVLPSASVNYMSGVIPYPYRQDPDFFYLTGLQQRGVLVLQSDTQGSHDYTLFIDPPNPERERWDGATVDVDAAQHVFGADSVHYLSQAPKVLSRMTQGASDVFFDTDRLTNYQQGHIHRILQTALPAPPGGDMQQPLQPPLQAQTHSQPAGDQQRQQQKRINPLRPLLHAMRMTKSPGESALMRASADLSAKALIRCIQHTRPGIPEFTIAAMFEYECKSRGAARMAFPQVVASGVDATTIHYGRNDKVLQPGQLLLMDAGCELFGYCSDVTRTWPISGRFTGPQRDVYDMVLDVHRRCVEACKPGSTLRSLHELSVQLLSEGIHALGVARDRPISEIQAGLYRQYYWHALGHWLGLDTHDTHLMGHDRQLQPGHVITIEPGLYIPDRPEYGPLRGIGVRIEDDVLVTPIGCEILSDAVPRLPADVEALVGTAYRSG